MKTRVILVLLILWTTEVLAGGPAWNTLSSEQQHILRQLGLEENWGRLPEARRDRLLRGLQRWEKMNPEQRKIARQNLKRWRQLPPERRKLLRERLKRFRSLPPERRRLLREKYHKFRQLPPKRRKALRERWRKMSPADRRAFRQRHFKRQRPHHR